MTSTTPLLFPSLQLREAAAMLQQALNAATVQEEEALWTQIIERYGKMEANWVPDLVRGSLLLQSCGRGPPRPAN